MRLLESLAAFAFVLVLASCGPSSNSLSIPGGGSVTTNSDGSVATIKGANGEVVQFGNSNAAATASLPDFIPLYPDAKVTANISAPGSEKDSKSGSVAFDTKATVADVVAFYKAKAVAAGLDEALNMSTPDGSTYMATKDKTMLQVIASKGSDATNVVISWSAPK